MTARAAEITVAIPTYNGAAHLAEALESILRQDSPPAKLLLCDDRSTDNTIELARSIAGDRIWIIENSERLGLAHNWNRCAEVAPTEWVSIFHQDDRMEANHLQRGLAGILESHDAGMICGAVRVIDQESVEVPSSVIKRPDLGKTDRYFPTGTFVNALAAENPVRCSHVFLRVAALRAVGWFDPSFRYAVDWECWHRIARGFPVRWQATPTVSIRWHQGSETHRFKTGIDDLHEVAAVIGTIQRMDQSLLDNPAQLRKAANHFLSRSFLNRSYEAAKMQQGKLAREALREAVSYQSEVLWELFRDPRLGFRLAIQFLSR